MYTQTVSMKGKSEFRLGLQAGLTIAIGYFPVALTFGLLAEQTGPNVNGNDFYEYVCFCRRIAIHFVKLFSC